MSVWNTLSAGLQKVQHSFDQVLEGDQTDGEEVRGVSYDYNRTTRKYRSIIVALFRDD